MTGKTDPGLTGLWRQSKKCNNLAAIWKLMEDLAAMKIGNNEVERDAWNRAANRIVKRGKERPKKKEEYSSEITRDKKYVATQMKARARQLLEKGSEQERNKIRLEVKKMKRVNEVVFTEAR